RASRGAPATGGAPRGGSPPGDLQTDVGAAERGLALGLVELVGVRLRPLACTLRAGDVDLAGQLGDVREHRDAVVGALDEALLDRHDLLAAVGEDDADGVDGERADE